MYRKAPPQSWVLASSAPLDECISLSLHNSRWLGLKLKRYFVTEKTSHASEWLYGKFTELIACMPWGCFAGSSFATATVQLPQPPSPHNRLVPAKRMSKLAYKCLKTNFGSNMTWISCNSGNYLLRSLQDNFHIQIFLCPILSIKLSHLTIIVPHILFIFFI